MYSAFILEEFWIRSHFECCLNWRFWRSKWYKLSKLGGVLDCVFDREISRIQPFTFHNFSLSNWNYSSAVHWGEVCWQLTAWQQLAMSSNCLILAVQHFSFFGLLNRWPPPPPSVHLGHLLSIFEERVEIKTYSTKTAAPLLWISPLIPFHEAWIENLKLGGIEFLGNLLRRLLAVSWSYP